MPGLMVREKMVNCLQKEEAIDREIDSYRQMHQELLLHYQNQCVAVYQGQVIDHDESKLALYLRIQAEYPQTPVLIRQVCPEVDRIINIRSPKLERG